MITWTLILFFYTNDGVEFYKDESKNFKTSDECHAAGLEAKYHSSTNMSFACSPHKETK